MGNVLTDSNGHVILAGSSAFEVTSSVDSNIQAGNIKKDVTILGVTGTYEGSGGGGGGGTTSVTPNSVPSTVYYTDSTESIVSFDPMLYVGSSISCLSGSMMTIVYDTKPDYQDVDILSNCTIIASISMGVRASYNRVVIYQVD